MLRNAKCAIFSIKIKFFHITYIVWPREPIQCVPFFRIIFIEFTKMHFRAITHLLNLPNLKKSPSAHLWGDFDENWYTPKGE